MTETAAAADAVEAAAEAAAAAAEAAEAVADAAAEEHNDEGAEQPPPQAVNPEGAHDDAVQLDHEQRITRAEDAIAGLAAAIGERPTFDEVRSMTPSYGEVVETAAAVAEAAAEEAVEEAADELREEDGEDEAAHDDIEIVEPETPPAQEEGAAERRGIFRW